MTGNRKLNGEPAPLVIAAKPSEMTSRILELIEPVVNGQPTEHVIDSVAAAMMAAVTIGIAPKDWSTVLLRYSARIDAFAASLRPSVRK